MYGLFSIYSVDDNIHSEIKCNVPIAPINQPSFYVTQIKTASMHFGYLVSRLPAEMALELTPVNVSFREVILEINLA